MGLYDNLSHMEHDLLQNLGEAYKDAKITCWKLVGDTELQAAEGKVLTVPGAHALCKGLEHKGFLSIARTIQGYPEITLQKPAIEYIDYASSSRCTRWWKDRWHDFRNMLDPLHQLIAIILGLSAIVGALIASGQLARCSPINGPTPTPSITSTSPREPVSKIVIGYIHEKTSNEYIRIDNQGPAPQDMTGWQIQSHKNDGRHCEPTNQWYPFPPGYILDPGASVQVHSGSDATDKPPTNLRWTRSYIWHDDGDVAVLYDSVGDEVDRYAYGECR